MTARHVPRDEWTSIALWAFEKGLVIWTLVAFWPEATTAGHGGSRLAHFIAGLLS